MKKLLQDVHRSHYMPNVGRQVMADGGVPSLDQIRQMMIGTAPPPSTPSPGAYTDPYGLKVAAPFVESMRDGYPTAPTPTPSEPEPASATDANPWLDRLKNLFAGHFAHGGSVDDIESILHLAREVARRQGPFEGRAGKDEGGPVVEGDVSFLPDDASPVSPLIATAVKWVTP